MNLNVCTRRFTVFVLTLSLFVTTYAVGTDVEVRPFEFVTRGYVDEGAFQLQTYGDIGLRLRSGFLARSEVVLGIQSDTLDSVDDITPFLRRASVTTEELFGSTLSFTYFIGDYDRLASGQAFPLFFGTEPVASQFRGRLYFPDGPDYRGIHGVSGVGLGLRTNELWNNAELATYAYQDNRFDPGVFSNDMNLMLSFDGVQIEAFAGTTYPKGPFGRYRGGLLAHFITPNRDALLAQIGVPGFEPGTGDNFGLDNLYFLFEPRVQLDPVGIALTFFWHPDIYNQVQNPLGGAIDTNLRVEIGNSQSEGLSGGVESRVSIQPQAAEQFSVDTTPFLRVNSGDVSWDVRAVVRPFPFSFETLLEGYLGVRTQL